jgi:hypothetical protein
MASILLNGPEGFINLPGFLLLMNYHLCDTRKSTGNFLLKTENGW